ncbi:MAG TPA: winged helix-turn-helix transcriptional regulator [Acidimicrobiia bacterium]|jgi:DNA-binding HxlR family transcriptional regulator
MARTYDQHCSLALALDVVGDRWALLIVRDLLLGPRRFGELLDGLPGIGTDILTARLRDLEAAGLVSRRQEGRASWYDLTDEGRALQPAMRELAVWGVRRFLAPPLAEQFSPRSTLTLLSMGAGEKIDVEGAEGRYEIRVEPEVATVDVVDGRVRAAQGPATDPTATVTFTPAGVLALVMGSPLGSLVATGEAEVDGDVVKTATVLEALSRSGIVARAFAALSGA